MKINTASTEDASCQRQFNSVCSALGVSTPIPALWSVNTTESVELKRHWTAFYFGLSGRVGCEWLHVAFLTRLIQGYKPSVLVLSAHYYYHLPPENFVFATLFPTINGKSKFEMLPCWKITEVSRIQFTVTVFFSPTHVILWQGLDCLIERHCVAHVYTFRWVHLHLVKV